MHCYSIENAYTTVSLFVMPFLFIKICKSRFANETYLALPALRNSKQVNILHLNILSQNAGLKNIPEIRERRNKAVRERGKERQGEKKRREKKRGEVKRREESEWMCEWDWKADR